MLSLIFAQAFINKMQAKAQRSKHFNLYTGSCISLGGMNGVNLLLSGTERLQSPTKVLPHLPTFAISVREFIISSSSPQFNVVYLDEVDTVRVQHCWGKWVPYSSDVIRYCPQNTLSKMNVFSCYLIQLCQGLCHGL